MHRRRPTEATGIEALLAAVRSILITVLAAVTAPSDDARLAETPTDPPAAPTPAPTAVRTPLGGVSA